MLRQGLRYCDVCRQVIHGNDAFRRGSVPRQFVQLLKLLEGITGTREASGDVTLDVCEPCGTEIDIDELILDQEPRQPEAPGRRPAGRCAPDSGSPGDPDRDPANASAADDD